MEYIKILKIADVREVLDKLGREEITYSKMVELLNIKINEQLDICGVVGRSEQLADHKCKPMVNADWTYLRCECGKRFEPKG